MPRKTQGQARGVLCAAALASMRPRPDAAENLGEGGQSAGSPPALQ